MSATLRGFAALALLAGCASPDAYPVDARGWRTHLAFEGDVKLNGIGCGDLDPASPGDEILACGTDGSVRVVRRAVVPPEEDEERGAPTRYAFESEVVLKTPGELIQLAVGDVDPAHPGDEAVVVGVTEGGEDDGAPGVAWYLRRDAEGGSWTATRLFEDDALLHAVAIGDFDPDVPGVEVALAGFTQRVWLVTPLLEGGEAREVAALPGNAKGLAPARGALAVACDDGSLALVRRSDDGSWETTVPWQFDAPLARVVGRGDEVLLCANDGVLRLLQATSDFTYESVTRVVVLDDRLRGAVFADVDPASPGEEAATAGYDGTVRVVALTPWQDPDAVFPPGSGMVQYRHESTIAAEDTDKLHHLASGELAGLGRCLVSAGYSGRILAVHAVPSGR